MNRDLLIGVPCVGLLVAAHFILPPSPWLGWVELLLMLAAGLWLFARGAGVVSARQQWLTLAENVTLGLLLVGLNEWPRYGFMVFMGGIVALIVLEGAQRTTTPRAATPLR